MVKLVYVSAQLKVLTKHLQFDNEAKMSTKTRSQSRKAIEARRWRVNAKEKKRFNKLVTEYVRFKYHDIYDECHRLYKVLDEKHSESHDLTKTRTFKRMIEDLKDQSLSPAQDLIDEPVPNTSSPAPNESSSLPAQNESTSSPVQDLIDEPVPNTSSPAPNEFSSSPAQNESTSSPVPNESSNILTEAIQETLAAHNYMNIDEIQNIDNVINEIINDLEENDAVRNILDAAVDDAVRDMFDDEQDQNEDEGIGLNLEEEIFFDIEPFDFELEVQDFEF